MSSKLVFFGNERLVSGLRHTDAPLLRGLIDRGYTIAAVVVNHTDATSRNARELEVAAIAEQHGIPLLSPKNPLDCLKQLADFQADAAVLAAYGRILPQRIIDVFKPVGIINLHPSLLPRHRGPTPIETTILAGDTEAGVSVMQLTAGMDEGPIYGQVTLPIGQNISKFELYEKLSSAGSTLLFDLLPDILSGTLQPKSQPNNDVSVTSLILKSDGFLDTTTDTATGLERKVRAYQGFPKPHLTVYHNDVIVTSASVAQTSTDGLIVLPCRANTWLRVDKLIAPSGRSMDAKSFLNGLRNQERKIERA